MSYMRHNSPLLWFDVKKSDVYVWSDGKNLNIDPSIDNPGAMDDAVYPIEVAGRIMKREVGYHDATVVVLMLAKNAGVEHLVRKEIHAYKCPKCNKNMPRPDWEYSRDEGFFCDNCKKSFTKKKILGKDCDAVNQW